MVNSSFRACIDEAHTLGEGCREGFLVHSKIEVLRSPFSLCTDSSFSSLSSSDVCMNYGGLRAEARVTLTGEGKHDSRYLPVEDFLGRARHRVGTAGGQEYGGWPETRGRVFRDRLSFSRNGRHWHQDPHRSSIKDRDHQLRQ